MTGAMTTEKTLMKTALKTQVESWPLYIGKLPERG
jgi:hypothetical protein